MSGIPMVDKDNRVMVLDAERFVERASYDDARWAGTSSALAEIMSKKGVLAGEELDFDCPFTDEPRTIRWFNGWHAALSFAPEVALEDRGGSAVAKARSLAKIPAKS